MTSDWMLNEQENAGDEHLDPDKVRRFDEKLPFDPDPEVERLLTLGLSSGDAIVEFGTGTGRFPAAAAPHCDRIVAIDVSEAMVNHVREKCRSRGLSNVNVVRAGFLSYEHEGDAAAFVYSKDALHHLPDFWKMEALKNIGRTLEAGGILRLRDFVFSFPPENSLETIASWIETKQETTRFTDEEIAVHFREEYSTYGFLLEAMLEKVGFEIIEATYDGDLYASYTCLWKGS